MSDDAPKKKRPPQLNRKPRSKQVIVEERIDQVIKAISENPKMAHCRLYKFFADQWGCHERSVQRIHEKAKAELHKRLNRSRETFRCESLAFYEAKRNDPKATVGQQLEAQYRIDMLLGLDAPHTTYGRFSIVEGEAPLKDVTPPDTLDTNKLSIEEMRTHKALLEKMLTNSQTEQPKGTPP